MRHILEKTTKPIFRVKGHHCAFIKEDGKQCRGWAMEDSEYCFRHNPAIPEKDKRLISARGGTKTTKRKLELVKRPLSTPEDAKRMMSEAINVFRAGNMPRADLATLSSAVLSLLKCMETADLANEMVEIRRIIFESKIITKSDGSE